MTVKMAALSCAQVLLMLGMLVTGSINTISKKAQNDCSVPGYPETQGNTTAPHTHKFDHPWFQTWIMFIGESICLIGLFLQRRKERQARLKELQEEGGDPDPPPQTRIVQLIVVVPTVCDLIGTSLAGIGLVYVDASVWQMLRGSIIIFAGILSKIFLKRQLKISHWLGMMVTMCGLILVGCSSVFKTQHKTSASKTLLGIVLIMSSQIVSASQMVIEETFLKKRNLHPLHVVGLEGTYGFFLMTLAVLPVMYFIPGSDVHNSYENSIDALYQISRSPRLLVFCLMYLTSIAFYNYFGLSVTRSLTAVHRTLIDACRTIMVWGVDLFIYYAVDKGFGEPFDNYYGLLQVDGFLFLMIGTALYNQLIHLEYCVPCVKFKSQEMQGVPKETVVNIQDDSYDKYDSDRDTDAQSEKSRLLGKNRK